MLEYIPNKYGRDWVSLNQEGVFLPLAFVDINEGNFYDAILFAQIMYWHKPRKENGKPRLTQIRDGFYWLAKNHGDWYEECRINANTVRKCLDRLKQRDLIVYELHSFSGTKTPWIRINWNEFEKQMLAWEAKNDPDSDQFDLSEHTQCAERTALLIQEVESNTEISSEIPSEDEKTLAPISERNPSYDFSGADTEENLKDAELRDVIADVWETAAPGRIQEIRKTLLGLHPQGSDHYESNIVPPATIEEIREMEDLYHRQAPDMKMPMVPAKIQDWLYQVRELVPGYIKKKGYTIPLNVKIPRKCNTQTKIWGYLRKYYPEEYDRIKFLTEELKRHPAITTEFYASVSTTCFGETIYYRVPVPDYLKTSEEINEYLEFHFPEEMERVLSEMERIEKRRNQELKTILLQG